MSKGDYLQLTVVHRFNSCDSVLVKWQYLGLSRWFYLFDLILEPLEELLSTIAQVENKIATGEVGRALQMVRAASDFPDPERELIQLSARWNAAERDMLESLMSEDDFKVERARITKRLLQFLGETRHKLEQEKADGLGQKVADDGTLILPDYDGKPQILILYAVTDEAIWEELQKHLYVAMRDDRLQFVNIHHDIPIGTRNREDYQKKMVDAARTVIALVTPNSLSLPIFPLAEQALVAGKLIPVWVTDVDLEGTPFDTSIKGLPNDGRFVDKWPDRNTAWVDVVKTLQAFFTRIKKEEK